MRSFLLVITTALCVACSGPSQSQEPISAVLSADEVTEHTLFHSAPRCFAYSEEKQAFACLFYASTNVRGPEALAGIELVGRTATTKLYTLDKNQSNSSMPELKHGEPVIALDEVNERLGAEGFVSSLSEPVELKEGSWQLVASGVELQIKEDKDDNGYSLEVRCAERVVFVNGTVEALLNVWVIKAPDQSLIVAMKEHRGEEGLVEIVHSYAHLNTERYCSNP